MPEDEADEDRGPRSARPRRRSLSASCPCKVTAPYTTCTHWPLPLPFDRFTPSTQTLLILHCLPHTHWWRLVTAHKVFDTPASRTEAKMSTPQSAIRQRGPKERSRPHTPNKDALNGKIDETWGGVKNTVKEAQKSDTDHKVAFTIITILGFLTRFWGISHPDQVVFDEVHFGKVSSRKCFTDN